MDYKPIRFIGEAVQVHFDRPPVLEKKPGPPDQFTWQDESFVVKTILSEWHDYGRKGRMARNMQPGHAQRASRTGSWGVGQDYYRVLTDDGRVFDLYYDRASRGVDQRKGEWVLYRELERVS